MCDVVLGEAVYRLIEAMEIVELTGPVLSRSQPLHRARHLGCAASCHRTVVARTGCRRSCDGDARRALATAAKASGLRVIGV